MINESDQNLSDTVQGKVKGRKIIGFYNRCQRKDFPNPYDLDYSNGIEITGEQTEEDQEKYPIREIFQTFGEYVKDNAQLSKDEYEAIRLISGCKTGNLGYNASYCPNCKQVRLHTRSCNSRICPNCQAVDSKVWIENRSAELIPEISYYHAVATVPDHSLNPLFLSNKKELGNLLISSSANAVIQLFQSNYGAKPGIISTMQSWGSAMNVHYHNHMIITGGGLTPDNKFIETTHKGFCLPCDQLSLVFRGLFMKGLKELYAEKKLVIPSPQCFEDAVDLEDPVQWMNYCDKLYNTHWEVYLKETFNGNGNALQYLGRYVTHFAMSNSRIVSFNRGDEQHPLGEVVFTYKDYKDGGKIKNKTTTAVDFICMLIRHVLPKGFCRIRYSGFLSNPVKFKFLKLIASLRAYLFTVSFIRGKTKSDILKYFYGKDISVCPKCNAAIIRLGVIHKSEIIELNS